MTWYAKVSKDIAHLPNCLDHFYNELDQAKTEVKIHGNVEKASASLPGIVEHRFNQLQEMEAILEIKEGTLKTSYYATVKHIKENMLNVELFSKKKVQLLTTNT